MTERDMTTIDATAGMPNRWCFTYEPTGERVELRAEDMRSIDIVMALAMRWPVPPKGERAMPPATSPAPRDTGDVVAVYEQALRQIATGRNRHGEKIDFFQDIAHDALATADRARPDPQPAAIAEARREEAVARAICAHEDGTTFVEDMVPGEPDGERVPRWTLWLAVARVAIRAAASVAQKEPNDAR